MAKPLVVVTGASSGIGRAITLLFAFGVLTGLSVAPTIAYYAATDPQTLWQAGAATALFVGSPPPVADAPETRLDIGTPRPWDPLTVEISPDGRNVVFDVFERGQEPRLWFRDLKSEEAMPLKGTEWGSMPFWSL